VGRVTKQIWARARRYTASADPEKTGRAAEIHGCRRAVTWKTEKKGCLVGKGVDQQTPAAPVKSPRSGGQGGKGQPEGRLGRTSIVAGWKQAPSREGGSKRRVRRGRACGSAEVVAEWTKEEGKIRGKGSWHWPWVGPLGRWWRQRKKERPFRRTYGERLRNWPEKLRGKKDDGCSRDNIS